MSRSRPSLPSSMESALRPDLSALARLCNLSNETLDAELRHLSYLYTCQLSVLYGMSKSIRGLSSREELTVHVVGARMAESADVFRWEVLAAFLPRLKRLTVVLMGPELR